MTNDEPEFDDPSYAEIRGLLAENRSTEPLPAQVAARLDETLAALVAERAVTGAGPLIDAPNESTEGVVVPLRRRSRLGPKLLVAAAAVVLVGAGGVGLSHVLTTSSDHRTSASAAQPHAPVPITKLSPEAGTGASTPGGTGSTNGGTLSSNGTVNDAIRVPTFTGAGFAAQAKSFTTTYYATSPTGASAPLTPAPAPTGKAVAPSAGTASPPPAPAQLSAARACSGPVVADQSTVIPILYDSAPATLVIHPAAKGSQLVEAWSCDGARRLNSVTVPTG